MLYKISSFSKAVFVLGSGIVIAAAAGADTPKTANEAVKYRRYNDPSVDPDVFKVLEASLVSTAEEIQAEGCKTGASRKLLKAKLKDAGDTKCPNGVNAKSFVIVIPGIVNKVEGDMVIVTYETTGAGGAKKTLTLPKELVSKSGEVKQGADLIFYPAAFGANKEGDVVKEFKIFETQMKIDPFSAKSKPTFSVQLK